MTRKTPLAEMASGSTCRGLSVSVCSGQQRHLGLSNRKNLMQEIGSQSYRRVAGEGGRAEKGGGSDLEMSSCRSCPSALEQKGKRWHRAHGCDVTVMAGVPAAVTAQLETTATPTWPEARRSHPDGHGRALQSPKLSARRRVSHAHEFCAAEAPGTPAPTSLLHEQGGGKPCFTKTAVAADAAGAPSRGRAWFRPSLCVPAPCQGLPLGNPHEKPARQGFWEMLFSGSQHLAIQRAWEEWDCYRNRRRNKTDDSGLRNSGEKRWWPGLG